MNPPDVLLFAPDWRERVLLRAELIEAGFDVAATDVWPIPSPFLNPTMQPRAVLVDLRGLSDPRAVLDQLRYALPPSRVLVISGLGTLPADQIRQMGYHVAARPATIHDIVETIARMPGLQSHGTSRTAR